ncbi:tyrosine-type recombinase/integrase [Cupriavidus sp. LEh25]|uniref:tyrosine-type recombinase/integrase n=1 Tax=Cupriavidus consociatus TaxID=2821357 RepID=UPI001AE9AC9E|nr:tyrosine-type recombinase/integrase [Cupriavidus sp. LEh25]
MLAIALRSFCRFLFVHGHVARDLSVCIPTVRRWRQAEIPAFLTPEQIERLLATTDRPISSGRRDRAVLLLLARLGLRPGEVATLELDDLHWRTGEITIRGKGRAVQCLPLLPDVGEALAAYLRENRGACRSRRVFLREKAPCGELAGPGAIGPIVCQALARAGIRRTSRGAAHLLRHSLATQMIRRGASLSQIAEVLRHRTENTTAISKWPPVPCARPRVPLTCCRIPPRSRLSPHRPHTPAADGP